MKNCITHHYACDCREEIIRGLFKELFETLEIGKENYTKLYLKNLRARVKEFTA